MFDEICLANPLEFDLEPVGGKPLPRAVNLRAAPVHAAGNGVGSAGARAPPRDSGHHGVEDSQLRSYRKQLVDHVVTRHKVERVRAQEFLAAVPGESLKCAVERFERRMGNSDSDTRNPTKVLGAACDSIIGGQSSPRIPANTSKLA